MRLNIADLRQAGQAAAAAAELCPRTGAVHLAMFSFPLSILE